MPWGIALVMAALVAAAVPADVQRWWGKEARPLAVRRVDVNLDGSRDLIAVIDYKGALMVSVACHHPERAFERWQRCGGFALGRGRGPGAPGPGLTGPVTVTRLQTGDLDGDGRPDLAVEVAGATSGWLSVGALLSPNGYSGEPELSLGARAFAIWDANGDGRAEVVAHGLDGLPYGPAFITFVKEAGGVWRRGHGAAELPAAGARPAWRPLVRVPDLRGETPADAARLLAMAGLRPGMVAAVDPGKGFRPVTAQSVLPGRWVRGRTRVSVGVAMPAAHAQVTDWGEAERVIVYGPGGWAGRGRRFELGPSDPEFAAYVAGLRSALGQSERRVMVGGPPFSGAYGPSHAYSADLIEFTFRSPLKVTYFPQRQVVEVRRVALPFTRYESGLAFLGTPAYGTAVVYTGGGHELQARASDRFFPLPRE